MSESKSKKSAPVHAGFEWAGAVARVRRGGKSTRAGRRAALLGMLTASYANSTRGAGSAIARAPIAEEPFSLDRVNPAAGIAPVMSQARPGHHAPTEASKQIRRTFSPERIARR